MTEREAQLEAALVANAAIRVQAEPLIAAYVAPECSGAGRMKRPGGSNPRPKCVPRYARAEREEPSAVQRLWQRRIGE
jgi:hypothetical protein